MSELNIDQNSKYKVKFDNVCAHEIFDSLDTKKTARFTGRAFASLVCCCSEKEWLRRFSICLRDGKNKVSLSSPASFRF